MKAPLHLLLLEDSDLDAELLLAALRQQEFKPDVTRVQTEADFRQAIVGSRWDLVISDYNLSGFDGMSALGILRERDPDLPFILVSGLLTEASAVEAIRQGANDFVLKSNLQRLGPIIERELRDTSNRQRARADQNELRLLQLAVRQVPDSLVITDPEGTILYVNPSMEAVSGYSRDELVGETPRLFKSGRHEAAFYEHLWVSLLRGEVWRGTFVNRRKDGQFWESQAVVAPVLNDAGLPLYFVLTSRDVSHERELQARLEQAQRLEAIGVLTGGIAHDFNNILMPIMGNAELGLERSKDLPQIQHHFEVIQKSALRASDLIQQILAFSRKQEVLTRPVDLALLLKESLKLMRATVPSSILFDLHLDPAGAHVLADPTQLHQVILNLCTNAAQSMYGLAGTLRVEMKAVETAEDLPCVMGGALPPGRYQCLIIADSGCGIPPELLDQIFFPFFTTKKQGQGTGLGLSIVHGLVQQMGGGLQVTSTPGQGTAFCIYLPTTDQEERRALPAPIAVPIRHDRLLVVDDEPAILDVLEAGLARLGFQVTRFEDPALALETFRQTPMAFDLLVSDLTMPHMTGLDLAEEVGLIRPGFPVLLMTGQPARLNAERAEQLGIRATVRKPSTPNMVALVIEKVLDGAAKAALPTGRSKVRSH